MVAAGTGIAPMIPVIRTVLENEDDETFVTLLFGCRRYRDVLCKTLLDDWARYWNFSCVFALSKVSESRVWGRMHPRSKGGGGRF